MCIHKWCRMKSSDITCQVESRLTEQRPQRLVSNLTAQKVWTPRRRRDGLGMEKTLLLLRWTSAAWHTAFDDAVYYRMEQLDQKWPEQLHSHPTLLREEDFVHLANAFEILIVGTLRDLDIDPDFDRKVRDGVNGRVQGLLAFLYDSYDQALGERRRKPFVHCRTSRRYSLYAEHVVQQQKGGVL